MRQSRIWIAVLAAVAVSLAGSEVLHRAGGLLYEDLSQVPTITEVHELDGGLQPMPLGYADLSSQMPPVGNQGAQGSCVAWAIGYYHKGHTEWLEQGWDQTQTTHQFSPAFMYNLINGGVDAGAYFSDALNLVANIGLAPMADMPYTQSNYTSWPSEAAWTDAIPYRGEAGYYISCTGTSGLDLVKSRLDAGYTTVLGINVYSNFDYINNFDTMYCVADRYGTNRGGHAVTFVGYDDSKVTHDGVGAFRMVNSWGTGWGNHGYWWMSYEAVMDYYLSYRQAMYVTDRIGYQPTLIGKLQVTHSARERVGIRLGVGRTASPLWYKDFLPRVTPSADYAFPANKIVLDMTEGAGYIAGGSTDHVFVRCLDNRSDARTGTLTYFSAEYTPWSVTGVSAETPVSIPDYGTAVYAGAQLAVSHTSDAAVVSISAPSGTVELGAVVTPSCQVKNNGTAAATFPVRMKIGAGYNQAVTVTGLAAGATQTVNFPNWTASSAGTFAVTCTTELAGDENSVNDKASGSVTVTGPVLDVGAVSIAAPSGTVGPGTVVTPSCQVQNHGTVVATFPVRMKIGADYEQVVTVTGLSAGATQTVNFPNWTASEYGTFNVTCSTGLSGDVNATNDKATAEVTVSAPAKDVGAATITAPSGTVNPGTAVTPSCVVQNYGTASVGFSVRMRIGSGYNEVASIKRLKGGATRNVSFPTWTASTPGAFAVICSTEFSSDENAANDKLTGSVTVDGDLIDAGVVSITAPSGTVSPGSVVTPSCQVKNSGTGAATFPVRMKIGAGYAQAVTVTGLAAGATQAVNFPNWTASENGTFSVTCSTELAGDENAENNRATGSVTVGTEMHDVACIQVITPVGTLKQRSNIAPVCSLYNYGTSTETYTVRMKIGTDYEQTTTVTHEPGTGLLATFKKWRASDLGEFAIACSTELTGDAQPANDKAVAMVTVTKTGTKTKPAQGENAGPVSAAYVDLSPNPVFGSATVKYGLVQDGPVKIELYDATGTSRATLYQGRRPAGRYTCQLRAGEGGLAAGVYFLRFDYGSGRMTRKVLVE